LLREAQTNMGVMIILEVEDVTINLNSSTVVKDAISHALENAGLTETSFAPFVSEDGTNSVFYRDARHFEFGQVPVNAHLI